MRALAPALARSAAFMALVSWSDLRTLLLLERVSGGGPGEDSSRGPGEPAKFKGVAEPPVMYSFCASIHRLGALGPRHGSLAASVLLALCTDFWAALSFSRCPL